MSANRTGFPAVAAYRPGFLRGAGCLFVALYLTGCGGGGDGARASGTGGTTPPGQAMGLAIDAGDGAVSLAWTAPSENGGAAIEGYTVAISPSAPAAEVTVTGAAATVTGLDNGSTYEFTVTASNSAGSGSPSAAVTGMPRAARTSLYQRISVPGDPNAPTGIFDPSLVNSSSGTVWLAYSSVNYHSDATGEQVQDVSTSVAKSVDGGATFSYLKTVGAAQFPVTVTDASDSVCGQPTCTGQWVYEVPFLIEDGTDPSSARRFKLFAHKYFLYPPGAPGAEHTLGAIVMWTASSPDGTWSAETAVLRWNGTPPEIAGGTNVNTLDPALAPCLLVTEGTAAIAGTAIDFAFNCTYSAAGTFPVKIVMLRSADHAQSSSYVSTLLEPADSAIVSGAAFFNAPALLPGGSGAPLLMVTPDNGTGSYLGCVVLPFASEADGTLLRNGANVPIPILSLATLDGHFGGACAWDRGATVTGILMDDLNSAEPMPFGIIATDISL